MGWGANLGGQISTFVGSLTKERAASPGKAALSAGSQSRLRGLFLREGGPANTAAAGVLPPATSAGEVLQNGKPYTGEAADVQHAGTRTLQVQKSCVPHDDRRSGCSREAYQLSSYRADGSDSKAEGDVSGRDVVAEELASALGTTAISTVAGSADSRPLPEPDAVAADSALPELANSSHPEPWGPGVSERLASPPRMLSAHHAAVTAVSCFATSEGVLVYCVSQAGSLKIFNMETGAQVQPLACNLSRPTDCLHSACMPSINYIAIGQTDFLNMGPLQVRAANLVSMPLTSLALIPPALAGSHPTVVTGCFDNKVSISAMAEY